MKTYKELTHDQKKEFWSNHIMYFKRSGLSQKKYCEQENLSYWSFRTWYYKTPAEKQVSKFIKLSSPCTEEKPAAKITMFLREKVRIEFDDSITEEILRKIFQASEVLND